MRVFPASVFLAVTAILLGAALAYAHSEGTSLEKQVGDYVVDIGYEPENLQAGQRLLLNFDLLDTEERPKDFTSVWVRLEEGSESLLATGVAKPAIGPATLLIKLPASGGVTLYARFERAGTVLAEASFPLSVGEGEQSGSDGSRKLLLGGLAGLIVGALGAFFLKRRT